MAIRTSFQCTSESIQFRKNPFQGKSLGGPKGTGSIKEISFPLTIGRSYKMQDLNPKLRVIMCCPNTIGFVTRVQIISNSNTQAMMIYMHEMVKR
jgi:hypothetical protein